MRTACALLFCFSLIAIPNAGAHQLPEPVRPPLDTRPIGKYLYAICTLSGKEGRRCERFEQEHRPRTVEPMRQEQRDGLEKLAQSISIALTCDPSLKENCTPAFPVAAGTDFYVKASADSGNPVDLETRSNNAKRGTLILGVQAFRSDTPGMVVLRATAAGNQTYLPAGPVDLMVQVADKKDMDAPCSLLPAPTATQSQNLDAAGIVTLLGSPTPFTLTAASPNVIAIYTTRQSPNSAEKRVFGELVSNIDALSNRPASTLGATPAGKAFTVELQIPHGGALGDLAARLGTLNYSQFTFQDVGRDLVRVTSTSTPDCKTWTTLLKDIKHMEWQLVSHAMSTKLFYLSSSDVATAFSALAPASGSSGGGGSSGGNTSNASGGSGGSGGGSSSGGGGSSASSGSATGVSTISVSQPPGSNLQISSDTTACVYGALVSGSMGTCGAAGSSPATSSPSSASSPGAGSVAPAAPPQMVSMAVAAGTGTQVPPDVLVFATANSGDDAQISERLRILAQLDLPRPEMIISAWVAQNSSTNQQAVAGVSNRAKTLVADYNYQLENVVFYAWNALKTYMDDATHYNLPFQRYVSNLFIADTFKDVDPNSNTQQKAQDFLDHSQGHIADPPDPGYRARKEICEKNRYCLGYTSLFRAHGVNPTLTDLLLTIIAAQDPKEAAKLAITAVEGNPAEQITSRAQCAKEQCRELWEALALEQSASMSDKNPDCTVKDLRGVLWSLFHDQYEPRVHLNCFDQESTRLLSAEGHVAPYPIGILRAALADFLFNYKMSQSYPHEFAAYDLTQSANRLNAVLNPLVDAFNRDLTAYQLFARANLQITAEQLNSEHGSCCVKRLFGMDKPSFYNDGLVSVRTISGQNSTVSTTSQSYLNAGIAPQLSAVLGSLMGAGGSSPGSGGGSGSGSSGSGGSTSPNLLNPFLANGPLASLQLANAVLSQYQSTYAQIGRSLNLTVTPRSLSTASSAEIAVNLGADEWAGNAPTYTGGPSNPAMNTSRIASHDVTTRVRVDSVKMFEISSFTAIVQREHSRFPLLPPFVEIPYIGTFAGIPLGAAKEFHSSTAILTAYVVPTAADLAFGLRYESDLVVDGANPGDCALAGDATTSTVKRACLYRRMFSLRDIDPSLELFNRAMVDCLRRDTSQTGCSEVTFDRLRTLAH